MASIVKRGKRYNVVYNYTDERGETKQKWEACKTYKEAQARKVTVESEMLKGTFIEPRKQTVEEFLWDFVKLYGEVRHVGDGLNRFLERPVLDFVDGQSKQNGQRKTENQRGQADDQCVLNHTTKIIGVEKFLKVLETHPRTAPDSLAGTEVLERDNGAAHRLVMEDDVIDNHYQNQRIRAAVFAQIPEQPFGQ